MRSRIVSSSESHNKDSGDTEYSTRRENYGSNNIEIVGARLLLAAKK